MAVSVSACGGAAGAGPETAERRAPDPLTLPPAEPPATEGTIARAELETVLAAGLGRFLGGVATAPHLDEGRFVGFRLTELRSALFQGVDLAADDTVLTVNGMTIERPEQALSVWNGLHVASELTVEYLRNGERRQLRFAIED